MELTIAKQDLFELVSRQLSSLYLLQPGERDALKGVLEPVLDRLGRCFSRIRCKGFLVDGKPCFNPFRTNQYCAFLYLLSRAARADAENTDLADKIYALNKALHAVDLLYDTELPESFVADHPLGTVLGRATYGNFFSFQQHNTIGNNYGRYPVIGEHVTLLAGASVVGDCRIGDNCWIAAGTFVKDQDVPDNSIVFGRSPDLVVKSRPPEFFQIGRAHV